MVFEPVGGVRRAAEPPATTPPSGVGQQKRGVRVGIEPANLTVEPGGSVTAELAVRNLGTRVEEFRLTAQGPGATFAAIVPPVVSVYPDDEQSAVLRVAPPRSPQARAGVAPFEIVASSAIHTDVVDVARGAVDVARFEQTAAVLTPEVSRGRNPARHRVTVANEGNSVVGVQVSFRDQDGELSFAPPGGSATLQPAESVDFSTMISGPRRIFGRTQRHPFTAVVTPAGKQPPVTLNGLRSQTAVLPWWIPTAAVAVIALVIAIIAILPGSKVPGVVGLDKAAAMQKLTDAGYKPVALTKEDDTVQAGMAIRTDPATGQTLKKGEPVTLFVSVGRCNGPCQVEVPNVEGFPVAQAQAKLKGAKFTVRVIHTKSDRPKDEVISSNPGATTKRPENSEVVLTVSEGPAVASAPPPPPPDACIQGYVWREAFSGDHVCVRPDTRDRARTDNEHANERRSPTGGPYGPNTCISGFVWRVAAPDDLVCVTPATRDATQEDNRLADSRRVH